MSDEEEVVPWEGRLFAVAIQFGQECSELRNTNPYAAMEKHTPLEQIIACMATELWDQNFSIAEIKRAFENAVSDLPRHANGHDRRSDEKLRRN